MGRREKMELEFPGSPSVLVRKAACVTEGSVPATQAPLTGGLHLPRLPHLGVGFQHLQAWWTHSDHSSIPSMLDITRMVLLTTAALSTSSHFPIV